MFFFFLNTPFSCSSFLSANLINGYDVYVSDNPDLPDSEWLYFPVSGSELPSNAFVNEANSLILRDLKPGHTYYVRINVRKKDGEILRVPSIYRFKTMGKSK